MELLTTRSIRLMDRLLIGRPIEGLVTSNLNALSGVMKKTILNELEHQR